MMKKTASIFLFAAAFSLVLSSEPAFAVPEITISGDQQLGPVTADADGRFTFVNVPLRRNAINKLKVTAKDGDQVQTKELSITQLSLDSVVVSKIKAQPLSVQEIEQLVNDGVIDIDDPSNFNVSKFEIVLTIGRREVPISFPMVTGKEEPVGSEEIKPQSDPGSGRSTANPPDIVIFEVKVPPAIPGEPPPPPIPGVLIIEGRIKTLKEFYSVRLLLLNTSGIFTLHDVIAEMEFPDGGLSNTLPKDGIVQFGDILPGDGEVPGQKEREFIIRGDEIGIKRVRVNFGGTVIGPGIPEDEIIPFNGSAETTVEVKGPPEFRVQVIHPPAVIEQVPYELLVDITNVGETPALYTSFELDVGADGELVDCVITESGQPECTPIEGSAVRNIGHLLPGGTTRQSFTINPLVSGPITSCMSIADQNIDLQVFVGAIGCLTGSRPPAGANPDGIPTVSVLPNPNSFGLGVDTPVVAFFNEIMNTSTITTGANGTFNVFDDLGNIVPGQLRYEVIADHSVVIWQPTLGPLAGNTTFTVNLSQTISDNQGFTLQSPWLSEFTTTDPQNDVTPPTLTLSIEPPVNPNNVIPGQIIRLNAYAADQGTALNRIEMRQMDTDVPGSAFALIDQKSIFPTTVGPYIFSVDSANLIPGHTYQFKATAFDNAGNSQDATIAAILAPAAAGPSIQLPSGPSSPVLQGISVTVSPDSVSAGVKQVEYYLDGQSAPIRTVTVAPFSMTLNTLDLDLGSHTIKALAADGLGQTGEDTFSFTLVENLNEPKVDFGSSVDGAQYIIGTPVSINGNVEDPLGVSSVAFYLDNPAGAPVAVSTEPFVINTNSLSTGNHKVYFRATNKLGVSNDINAPESVLEFEVLPVPPPAPPPAAPSVTNVSYPVNGQVTVTGTSIAGARIDILNATQGLPAAVYADGAGAFTAAVAAEAGNLLRLTALKLDQSPDTSAAAEVVVPEAPVLDNITVDPVSRTFTAANQVQAVTVTGHYAGGSAENVTAQAAFSSSDPSVASVNSAGRITGLSNGSAVITASFQGKSAQIVITVDIVVMTGISINPPDFTLTGFEKTRQIEVLANYSDGSSSPVSLLNAVLSSSNPSVATVGGAGIVTSKSAGTAVITATVSGFPPAQSTVTVNEIVPVNFSVSPNAVLFTEEDETRQLELRIDLSDGSFREPEGPVEFSSSDSSVASVDSNGLVTAGRSGDATIHVSAEGFTKTVTVVVDIPEVELPPPEITRIDRPRAGEGDVFVIQGKNFAPVPGENTVLISGQPAVVQSARQDELAVIVPKGAVSGPVSVAVDGDVSNTLDLQIYPRVAESFLITPAVDMPAASGAKLELPGPLVDFRTGDKVYLSSAPDILAPLDFGGVLRVKAGSGSFFNVSPSSSASDISALFSAGELSVTLELSEAGGKFLTAPVYLIAGPDSTGPIAGMISVMANNQSRPTPVTFINLKDASGNPLPDGAKVAVTAEQHCFRNPANNSCIGSHGGSIINGEDPAAGYGLRIFTVKDGRIDVIYDPVSAAGLRARQSAGAAIQVMPANDNSFTSSTALVLRTLTLTSFDTAGTPRSQTSAVADGFQKIVTIKFAGARDTAGRRVPDGTPVLLTVEQHCFRDVNNNSCIGSAGGSILSGEASTEGYGLRKHILSGGETEVQYSPGNFVLAYPDTATANLQWVPSRPDGSRIESYAFQITPVTLSSAQSPEITSPSSVFADTGDNRIVINFKNFKDAAGNPVPDGTKVVVTAEQHCFRHPVDNSCIPSAGGVIVSGAPSPDGYGLKVHEIQGGQTQVTYSAQGLGMESNQSALVTVQMMPSNPAGSRIGSRALAIALFTASGYHSASFLASPSAVVADGLSKTVTITLSNIRDTEGNVVPDGAVVLLTPEAHCFRNPADNSCIPSRGGTIKTGTASPDGYGFKAHTVSGGQITAEYDPGNVLLEYPDAGIANIQVIPGRPGSNSRIGNRAFAIVPVTLSSLQQADVVIDPASIVANNGENLVQITVSNIKDGAGNAVPDGTKIAVTPEAHCFRDPVTNGCIASAGGAVTSGTASPDGYGLRVHEIVSGSVQVTYSSAPLAFDARDSSTARIQFLPAQPSGSRVGNRAFTVAAVTIAGYHSADISGPGQLAPGAVGTYVVSNIRDTAGNLLPDGARIVVTPEAHCFRDPETGGCIGSLGGAVINGTASPEGYGFKAFTISGGQITVQFQAPGGTGTSVLQFLPARPNNFRIGGRAFAVKSVSVQS